MMGAADDASSVALLRGLRSGDAEFTLVHHIDVCSAAPEHLVANLDPVPGTDLADGGYNSVWLFYCPKRFKNAQGKPSGHRHRAIAGGDTCWHSETRPKPVKGVDGATICNLSYGRKEEGSSRSFNRMGWCMTEYDDNHGGGGDHVLCKVYRSSSSLAKRKSKPMIERLSGSKRKATKISHCFACTDQEFYQVQPPLLTSSHHQMTMPAQEEQVQVQENTMVTEQSQQNTQSLFPAQEEEPDREQYEEALEFLSQQDNIMFTIDELLGVPSDGEEVAKQNTQSYGFSEDKFIRGCSCTPTAMAPPDAGFSQGLAF
ncbi:unnamed protein product [Urochloa decumbens]|uniref:NAC domain-containing protein n=1 Tax=Urochloa decumbens TaxID=240449 RepID=A0ABC8Y6F0_9POAL